MGYWGTATHLKPDSGSGHVERLPVILHHSLEIILCHQISDHGQLALDDATIKLARLNYNNNKST